MLRIFAAALVISLAYVSAASARGGGAEPMPGTNFTDLPSYHPKRIESHKIKHARKHARSHQGIARNK
jgi:hypothetical protein